MEHVCLPMKRLAWTLVPPALPRLTLRPASTPRVAPFVRATKISTNRTRRGAFGAAIATANQPADMFLAMPPTTGPPLRQLRTFDRPPSARFQTDASSGLDARATRLWPAHNHGHPRRPRVFRYHP